MLSPAFNLAFAALNPNQLEAVVTTEGPVTVLAGPGSGKTQLLSLRIAYILDTTDTAPSSIVCLTYTDSASINMRERLSRFVSPRVADQVTIKTFHSFASEVLTRHQHLTHSTKTGALITPFAQSVLLRTLIESLPFGSKLTTKNSRGYMYLSSVKTRISELKKAAQTPADFAESIQEVDAFCSAQVEFLNTYFVPKHTNSTVVDLLQNAIETLTTIHTTSKHIKVFLDDLTNSLTSCLEHTLSGTKITTKYFTALKKKYLGVNSSCWKFSESRPNLSELSILYTAYQNHLDSEDLMDFDDMLLTLEQELVTNSDFKLALQEQYQYIMVDEFQDNNAVQNTILFELGDNVINEGNPNILVVGDDDQAVYKFGGANLTVFKQFEQRYQRARRIVLNYNYRSAPGILEISHKIAADIEDRVDANKINTSSSTGISITKHTSYPTTNHYYTGILATITAELTNPETTIALIAKEHKDLLQLANYLRLSKIPFAYQKSENILENKTIRYISILSRYITSILDTGSSVSDDLLPSILAHPCWNISRVELWKLASTARTGKWIDALIGHRDPKLQQIGQFLLEVASSALTTPAEETLGVLIGSVEVTLDNGVVFTSPLKSYLLNYIQVITGNTLYIETLQALKSAYHFVQEQKPGVFLTLKQALFYITEAEHLGIPIQYTTRGVQSAKVTLITAHSAKGLEFDTVILLNSTKENWFGRGRPELLNWPPHLPYSPEKNTTDDHLRLLYVAVTRAKHNLLLVNASHIANKKTTPLDYVPTQVVLDQPIVELDKITEADFVADSNPPYTHPEQDFLINACLHVQISATSLCTFVDLVHGGPSSFLERHLLKFPSADSTNSRFGRVIHTIFETALVDVQTTGLKPLDHYKDQLAPLIFAEKIRPEERDQQLARANKILDQAYIQIVPTFSPTDLAEYNFGADAITLSGVPVNGKVDRITQQSSGLVVYDYKTSKPLSSYSASPDKYTWQKLKYTLQFIMYQQAINQSTKLNKNQVALGVFQFVDGRHTNELEELRIQPNQTDIDLFTKLLVSVYKRVTTLDFPAQEELDQFRNSKHEFDDSSTLKFIDWLINTKS